MNAIPKHLDAETERALERFVEEEVRANVTCLINRLIDLGEEEYPIIAYDWQEAAEEAGWQKDATSGAITRWTEAEGHEEANSWQQACELHPYIEPVEREIFQYFIVSSFLADELEAEGEPIVHDYYGQPIWGRTTFGQSIAIDGCIMRIYDRLFKQTGGEEL